MNITTSERQLYPSPRRLAVYQALSTRNGGEVISSDQY